MRHSHLLTVLGTILSEGDALLLGRSDLLAAPEKPRGEEQSSLRVGLNHSAEVAVLRLLRI